MKEKKKQNAENQTDDRLLRTLVPCRIRAIQRSYCLFSFSLISLLLLKNVDIRPPPPAPTHLMFSLIAFLSYNPLMWHFCAAQGQGVSVSASTDNDGC